MRPVISRVFVPLFALSLFGWGCVRVAPRIVQAPTTSTETPGTPAVSAAFLRLNGGEANVTRSGSTVKAQDNTELAQGDTVVATRGTVELVYPDAGASQISAGSTVRISAFSQIKLLAGNIWTRFEKVFGPGERFSITANGVVATVRGTGFGVTMKGQEIDVEVAEHQVDIATESKVDRVYHIEAGQGVKVNAVSDTFVPRNLNDVEKQSAGFLFASHPIPADQLQAPSNPVQLNAAPTQGFVAPTRGVQQNEIAPQNTTPQVQGPTTTQ